MLLALAGIAAALDLRPALVKPGKTLAVSVQVRGTDAAALKELKRNGKLGLKETVARSGLDVAAALTGDEKFDGPLNAFLEKNGLKELC